MKIRSLSNLFRLLAVIASVLVAATAHAQIPIGEFFDLPPAKRGAVEKAMSAFELRILNQDGTQLTAKLIRERKLLPTLLAIEDECNHATIVNVESDRVPVEPHAIATDKLACTNRAYTKQGLKLTAFLVNR